MGLQLEDTLHAMQRMPAAHALSLTLAPPVYDGFYFAGGRNQNTYTTYAVYVHTILRGSVS